MLCGSVHTYGSEKQQNGPLLGAVRAGVASGWDEPSGKACGAGRVPTLDLGVLSS